MQSNHPKLERRYILFEYTECDREAEGTGLSLYKLNGGQLETIISSSAIFDSNQYIYNCVQDPISGKNVTPCEYVISRMVGLGVEKVVSVLMYEDFYQIPFGCQCDDIILNDEGECESWYEFSHPTEDSDYYGSLVDAGIELRFYDPRKCKFFS